MAQNGMFRNSMRGFNKQDVLQYIDEITAGWHEERQALEQKANEAVAAQEALQTVADEATAAATAAAEQQQVTETQLAEAQQKLYDTTADLTVAATTIEEMATQLEEMQRRMAQLEQELADTAAERDNAIAALADAKAQLAENEITARLLEDSRRQVAQQGEQISQMQDALGRYEKVLGNADTAHQRVEGIVRPFVEQANRQAGETLDTVQATLGALLAQLGDLQSDIDRRRQSLQYSKTDSDNRLTAALNEWLDAAHDAGNNRHFFP